MKLAGQNIDLNDIRWTTSAIWLVAVNVLPIIGVLLLKWDVGILLWLYWIESAVLGLLNIPKILSCQGQDKIFLFRHNTQTHRNVWRLNRHDRSLDVTYRFDRQSYHFHGQKFLRQGGICKAFALYTDVHPLWPYRYYALCDYFRRDLSASFWGSDFGFDFIGSAQDDY